MMVVTKGKAVSKGTAATLGLRDWDRHTQIPLLRYVENEAEKGER
jgi:hypothetical protein